MIEQSEAEAEAEVQRNRAEILLNLYGEEPSTQLQAFFERLQQGSSAQDLDTFVEGIMYFAHLNGSEREKYYGSTLHGLHYSNSFTALWNEAHPQWMIEPWDLDMRHQCPPSWTNTLQSGRRVLTYGGEAPLSYALNELVHGPTTLDCGMFCQLIMWIGIRYLIGDISFDDIFKFRKGDFVLTQNFDVPVNKDKSMGNLLQPFYDPLDNGPMATTTRIITRSVFNYPTYLAKHPGGEGLLHNVTQVNDLFIIFDPDARKTVLSQTELDQELMRMYNAPRDPADFDRLWLFDQIPDHVHSDFAPKSFGDLAEEARKYESDTIDENDWAQSRPAREEKAVGLHLEFNFERLIDCMCQKPNDLFLEARRMQAKHYVDLRRGKS